MTTTSLETILSGKITVHIFGYGSLTWKPDFEYDRSFVGYVKGYERRFWQASTYHRGTVISPGLCVTLTPVDKGKTWGLVYEVRDAQKIAAALDYLNVREQKIGGYEVYIVPVYPLVKPSEIPLEEENDESMYSILYIATPECRGYVGETPYDSLAASIATARGEIGHNIEYLFRLTDFMRKHVPTEPDEHLYTLDSLVRRKIGLRQDGEETWEQLLADSKELRKLVFPHQTNYKRLWKEAINRQVRQQTTIDRWGLLLLQIQSMKCRRSVELERIDFGDSLDVSDSDENYKVKNVKGLF